MEVLEEDLGSSNGPVLQSCLHHDLDAVLRCGFDVCCHGVAHHLVPGGGGGGGGG